MDIKIGIMQGRLSAPLDNKIQRFPRNSWRAEFEAAARCGFETLEWIFDLDNNPILFDEQIVEIKSLATKHGIKINSLLADYFMEKKLVRVSEFELAKNLETLKKLIEKCSKIGISILEIPFVDSSSLTSKEDEDQLIAALEKILPLVRDSNVSLALETDLEPNHFLELLSRFEHKNIFANYDTGNSSSLGYDVAAELSILGKKIKNIHIKDRLFRGNTVPLGKGDTDFDVFFAKLKEINYKGDLIIQGAREEDVPPEVTCKKYLEFVKQYVHKHF
ncbi:sugar phosphate isomerase/epimerase [Candidatus Parcubacteria bacterium]|nr:MAG: sugar phosphate isomerase/epimerase [Candidatus Parcubacteria bacterium]